MTDNEIIIAVAKLDGWTFCDRVTNKTIPYSWDVYIREGKRASLHTNTLPHYMTSRDAIISVIEKFENCLSASSIRISDILCNEINGYSASTYGDFEIRQMLFATPKQLCIALLKATGKWEE